MVNQKRMPRSKQTIFNRGIENSMKTRTLRFYQEAAGMASQMR